MLLVDVWHPDLDEAGRALVREELECATPPRNADPRNSSATVTVLLWGPRNITTVNPYANISWVQIKIIPGGRNRARRYATGSWWSTGSPFDEQQYEMAA